MTRGLAGACLLGLSWLLIACNGDDASSSTPTVPTIELSSLTTSEGSSWSADSDGDPQLTLPCDGSIAVAVVTEHWTARAPGACGQTQSCGHTEAVVTAENGATSNAVGVVNPLLKLPRQSLAEWGGQGTLLARLVHDDNSPYLDAAGAEIADTVNVTFSAPVDCSSTGGSSTGGSSTGGSSTGGSSTGGSGGAGGASN